VYSFYISQQSGSAFLSVNGINEFQINPGNPNSGTLYLNSGDNVRIVTNGSFDYIASASSPGDNDSPNLFWAMTLEGGIVGPTGPAGPSGVVSPESFMIALDSNFDTIGLGFEPITVGFTDTVDTGTFTAYAPENLYQNLTAGSLNLSTGEFTVGTTGEYDYHLTVYDSDGNYFAALFIDDGDAYLIASTGDLTHQAISGTVSLTVGQTIRAWVSSLTVTSISYTALLGDITSYNINWGMTLQNGIQGPTGPSGANGTNGVVASIVPDFGVAVDNTDPANPIVSLAYNTALFGANTVAGSGLNLGGSITLYTAPFGAYLSNIFIVFQSSWTGGDRDIVLKSSTNVIATISSATILAQTMFAIGSGIVIPYILTSGTVFTLEYSGGTTDYTTSNLQYHLTLMA
jgi:hypothetical protein